MLSDPEKPEAETSATQGAAAGESRFVASAAQGSGEPLSPGLVGVDRPAGDTGPAVDSAERLRRIEQTLGEIRGILDAQFSDARHKDFSFARLAAALGQSLALGLMIWAAVEWRFDAAVSSVILKLGFAAVLQAAALTGFVLAGQRRD